MARKNDFWHKSIPIHKQKHLRAQSSQSNLFASSSFKLNNYVETKDLSRNSSDLRSKDEKEGGKEQYKQMVEENEFYDALIKGIIHNFNLIRKATSD